MPRCSRFSLNPLSLHTLPGYTRVLPVLEHLMKSYPYTPARDILRVKNKDHVLCSLSLVSSLLSKFFHVAELLQEVKARNFPDSRNLYSERRLGIFPSPRALGEDRNEGNGFLVHTWQHNYWKENVSVLLLIMKLGISQEYEEIWQKYEGNMKEKWRNMKKIFITPSYLFIFQAYFFIFPIYFFICHTTFCM